MKGVEMETPSKTPKKESRRILRRSKTLKENPDRFSGGGVDFRAKIIGTERVVDARGNRMCQGALQRLKAAVKASGEHKQRILLNISLEGIILKDEKSGIVLHHHPIHKISFISQDTADSRAFGYVYGCPQNGHDFFALKTDKMASQVVLTLRDLFLTALDLKKKELDEKPEEDAATVTENGKCEEGTKPAAVDTLLDLQFSMDSLKQGISHMDQSITRGFNFSLSEDDASDSVPFHFKIEKLSSLYQETLSLSSRSSSTSECKETASSDHSEPHEDRYAVFLEDIDALPSVFDNPSTSDPPAPTFQAPSLEDFFQTSPKRPPPSPGSIEAAFGAQRRVDLPPEPCSPAKKPLEVPFEASFENLSPKKLPVTDSPPLTTLRRVDYHLEDVLHLSPKKPPLTTTPSIPENGTTMSVELPPTKNYFYEPPSKPDTKPACVPFPEEDLFDISRNKDGLFFDAPSTDVFFPPRAPCEAPRSVDPPSEHFFPPSNHNPFVAAPALPPKKCPFPQEEDLFDKNPFNPFDLPPPSSPPPPPPPPRLPPHSPPPRPPGRPQPLSWASFDSPLPPLLPSPARKKTFPLLSATTEERDATTAVAPLLPPKKPSDSSSASVSSSSGGTRSSSSLAFSSSESGRGSCGEPLVSSWEVESPDSIFRRKEDPFADDFFLTLPKRNTKQGFKA